MKLTFSSASLLALVFGLSLAHADEPRVIAHARIKVGDLMKVDDASAEIDLGPAPPPGAARLVAKSEIEDHLRAAGKDPRKLKIPASVRVISASLRFSPDAMAKLATPVIEKALPAGVMLTKVEIASEVVTHPNTTVRAAIVPKLPRQKGPASSSAMLELVTQDGVVTKIPASITVDVSEAAAHADVPRGGRVEAFYERGSIKIATTAVALADVDVGETTQLSLVATGRVVRAKVLAKDRAEILENR